MRWVLSEVELTRYRYEIDLRGPVAGLGDDVRNVRVDDLEALAHLMLESYRGTIDYEDEDLDDARAEVRSYLEAGQPMLEHSLVGLVDGEIVSAVLVSSVDGLPFISFVMTLPEHKGRGWGGRLVRSALASLAGAGHEKVVLYITEGNLPSEALFGSLDARRVGD